MQNPDVFRAFCWLSRQPDHPIGANEIIAFGLVDTISKKWLSRLIIIWPNGSTHPEIYGDLEFWCDSVRFRKLAAKLKALLFGDASAWRVTLELCACDFKDMTAYINQEQESDFLKSLHDLEERISRMQYILRGKDHLV